MWTQTQLDANTIVIKDELGITVCTITHPHWDDRAKRNAALICAAPVLLQELEQLVDKAEEDQSTGVEEGLYDDEPREDLRALNDLIQKAKGGQHG